MTEAGCSLSTPLGELVLKVQAPDGCTAAATSAPFLPTLPPGMKVDACEAIWFSLRGLRQAAALRLRFELRPLEGTKGTPHPGEHLEAMIWQREGAELAVGTEDANLLHARLGVPAAAVECTTHATGLVVTIQGPFASDTASLHALVAGRQARDGKDACWFAVDQPHARVREQVAP